MNIKFTKCPACNSKAIATDGICVDCRSTPETMEALTDPFYSLKYRAIGLQTIQTMLDFIAKLAEVPCLSYPGEYPESGESGKAPCLYCEAREILSKIAGEKYAQK